MSLLGFLSRVVLISLSGVMMPGPMSAVTMAKGSDSPHVGAVVAFGHAVVEIPIILLILLGIGRIFDNNIVMILLNIIGGVVLLFLAVSVFSDSKKDSQAFTGRKYTGHSVFIYGIMVSIGNPYFVIWWVTVGTVLAMQAVTYGLIGLFLFIVAHFFCDLVWYYFLSLVSFAGKKNIGIKFQKTVTIISSSILFIFGSKFVFDGLKLVIV